MLVDTHKKIFQKIIEINVWILVICHLLHSHGRRKRRGLGPHGYSNLEFSYQFFAKKVVF